VPLLGDGRAHLLAEVLDCHEQRREIQLKGSGRTPFSRGGDGRSPLAPALREYIISEAMHGLNIPTTRSLAVVTTGETVAREATLPGGVVTRVAASHWRVGSFEFAARLTEQASRLAIFRYVLQRHDPDLVEIFDRDPHEAGPLFWDRVSDRQIALLVDWMRVGFVHGVMNTDNMTISGETIDFGPCAFLDAYDPDRWFSAIDHAGRYRYAAQPTILRWNLTRLAESVLSLGLSEEASEHERVKSWRRDYLPRLEALGGRFATRLRETLSARLGFERRDEAVDECVDELYSKMRRERLDLTQTFDILTRALGSDLPRESLPEALRAWSIGWEHLRELHGVKREEGYQRMRRLNPVLIPRNHEVEACLALTVESVTLGDTSPPTRLLDYLEALRRPYDEGPLQARFAAPPQNEDLAYRTHCGT
jgi:uncharacterized protein YdiU (UPF0061 family)